MSSINFLMPWIENLLTLERLKYTRVFRRWLATTNPPTSGKSERTEPDAKEGWGAFLCAVDYAHCAAIWTTLRKDVCGLCASFDGSWNKAAFYVVSLQGCMRRAFWGGLAPTTARLAEKIIVKKWNKTISSHDRISGSGLHAACHNMIFFAGAGRRSKEKKYLTSNNFHWRNRLIQGETRPHMSNDVVPSTRPLRWHNVCGWRWWWWWWWWWWRWWWWWWW